MSPPLAYAMPTDAPPGLHLATADDAHRADPRGSHLSGPQRAAALALIIVALAILGPGDDTPAPAEPPPRSPAPRPEA
jgi:hypothetical protein